MVRVMLVDDEESALEYLDMLLSDTKDIEIVGKFINSYRALEEFGKLKADVVFLDIQMPGIQGMDLATRMHQLLPDVRIVFTTAYSDYAIEAFQMNAVDYLLKPFTKERLLNAVARFTELNIAAPRNTARAESSYVQLMGGLYIHAPGITNGVLSWKLHKEKELCAFLLHQGGKPMNANAIIEAVWSDSDPFNAKTYLYTSISYLRKNLKGQGIPIYINKLGNDGYTLTLEGLHTDVAEFEQLLDTDECDAQYDEQLLAKLEHLFKGGYLQDCDFEWAVPRREQLNNKFIFALQSMYRRSMERFNLTLAEKCLQIILQLSPDAEKEGRDLISLYLRNGRRNDALKLYHKLVSEVRRNLGVELEEETIQLYRQLIL